MCVCVCVCLSGHSTSVTSQPELERAVRCDQPQSEHSAGHSIHVHGQGVFSHTHTHTRTDIHTLVNKTCIAEERSQVGKTCVCVCVCVMQSATRLPLYGVCYTVDEPLHRPPSLAQVRHHTHTHTQLMTYSSRPHALTPPDMLYLLKVRHTLACLD